jgi:hypothetical protein
MDYQNVYDYCKDISQNLGVSVKFVHADKQWLNLISPNDGITLWSLPFQASYSIDPIIQRSWTLSFIIYQQDQQGSQMDQNDVEAMQESIKTVAITDQIAERFVRLFNSNSINNQLSDASGSLTITSASTDVAIQDTAQLLTATNLVLTVDFPDNFDYCCIPNAT